MMRTGKLLTLVLSLSCGFLLARPHLAEDTTFYGSREIGIKDPAGHYITFAQFAAQPQH